MTARLKIAMLLLGVSLTLFQLRLKQIPSKCSKSYFEHQNKRNHNSQENVEALWKRNWEEKDEEDKEPNQISQTTTFCRNEFSVKDEKNDERNCSPITSPSIFQFVQRIC